MYVPKLIVVFLTKDKNKGWYLVWKVRVTYTEVKGFHEKWKYIDEKTNTVKKIPFTSGRKRRKSIIGWNWNEPYDDT